MRQRKVFGPTTINKLLCFVGKVTTAPQSGLLLLVVAVARADNNFLTGANDVVAVEGPAGQLVASPFHIQFGKADIWLPRSGHMVTNTINTINYLLGFLCQLF